MTEEDRHVLGDEPLKDPRVRAELDRLQNDLTAHAEQHLIGLKVQGDRTLQMIEEAAVRLYGEDWNVDATATDVWRCSHPLYWRPLTVVEETLSIITDGPELVTCQWTEPRPRWWNLYRRTRLRLTGSPGRCPLHGRRLTSMIDLHIDARYNRSVPMIYQTVRVEPLQS